MTEQPVPVVRLQHTFPVPPDRVYRAWLDPDFMQRWFAAPVLTVTKAEVDERVGGAYRVWHRDESGDAGGAEAEILELVPNERIVLRWNFVGPDRYADPAMESRLTVTFRSSADGGTVLALTHERLDGLHARMPQIAGSVHGGWTETLESLDGALR